MTEIAKRLRAIRNHVKAGRCSEALRAYKKLPESVRYRDSLGPLKAAINSCPVQRRGLGLWPFSKKKPKQLPRDPRRMAQTVMYIPSPSGRVNQVLRGARKRRRR